MAIKNTLLNYGSKAKFLHWLIALGVIMLVVMGFMLGIFKNDKWNDLFYMLHKSIGLTILALTLYRLAWRWLNPKPQLSHLPLWQQKTAQASHHLFYLLLLAMPLSGWIMSVAAGYPPEFFNLITMSLPIHKNKELANLGSSIHKILGWVIIAMISLHILAALKHYFINKDNVLQRMLPNKSNRRPSSIIADM